MKKILQLRASGALLGAENVVLELSSPLSEKYGYQSVIGVLHDTRDPYPEIATQAEQRNIPFKVFQTGKKFDRHCIKSIAKYLKDENIDIVHAHGYREDIYVFLSFCHITKIATNHLWKKNNTMLKLYAFVDSLCLIFFQHIIAVSQPILNEMRAIPFLSNKKLSLIANGINTVKYSPTNASSIRQDLGLADDITLLSTISSLSSEKGHTYLLSALERLLKINTNFHLIIIGEGPEQSNIETQIKTAGLSRHVTLLGNRSDIDKIHTGTDIYILPSLKEGLPMSLLEAMACGTACIASDVGDVASCIKNNETGMLVTSAKPDELYQAIYTLLPNSEKRKQIGSAASRLINESFSNEKMIQAHAELYDQLLKSN